MVTEGLHVSIHQHTPFEQSADLSCSPGQVLALVGPSGSGKSTLLRAIAGLNQNTNGRVSCAGQLWQDSDKPFFLPSQFRKVGMVFQNYALFPHLTVLENVMEGACMLPLPVRQTAANNWLSRVHMHGMEMRYPHQLSGGQQQRVALARALVGNPRLLLLDEPFSAVDRVTREKLYQELAVLRTSLNVPTLLVTHDVDEAVMLADSLCIYAQGQILQTDPPMEVTAHPKSGQVARLVGHRNIFRAQVIRHEAEHHRTLIEWRGIRLTCSLNSRFPVGSQISWVVARSHLLLLDPLAASSNHHDNIVSGTVQQMIELGETVLVKLTVAAEHLPPLHLNLPTHLISNRQLGIGKIVSVSLRAKGIWLMENDKYKSQDQILLS